MINQIFICCITKIAWIFTFLILVHNNFCLLSVFCIFSHIQLFTLTRILLAWQWQHSLLCFSFQNRMHATSDYSNVNFLFLFIQSCYFLFFGRRQIISPDKNENTVLPYVHFRFLHKQQPRNNLKKKKMCVLKYSVRTDTFEWNKSARLYPAGEFLNLSSRDQYIRIILYTGSEGIYKML